MYTSVTRRIEDGKGDYYAALLICFLAVPNVVLLTCNHCESRNLAVTGAKQTDLGGEAK